MTKQNFDYLPSITVSDGVTIRPSENDEKLAWRCILIVKGYGGLDSVSTLKW